MPESSACTTSPCRPRVDMSEENTSSSSDRIRVFVRARPVNERESGGTCCLTVLDTQTVLLHGRPDKHFAYDCVFGEEATQEDLFQAVGRPAGEGCLAGYHGTVLAYGQTGSGKTFTMHGPGAAAGRMHEQNELRGLTPRTFEHIFNLIARKTRMGMGTVVFECKCSFLEIYNDDVFDLLDHTALRLQLRENPIEGVFAAGCTERVIESAEDANDVLRMGSLSRRVGSTSMNRESSRSHSVFTVFVTCTTQRNGVTNVRKARLHLVDLAGSERQKRAQTASKQLKEASHINSSLSALGNVIHALVREATYVPYRDSTLTFFLRNSLGGNTQTFFIATVSPSDVCYAETLSTLRFADRAKSVRVQAMVNENTMGSVEALQAELRRVQMELHTLRGGGNLPFAALEANNGGLEDSRICELESVLAKAIEREKEANKERDRLQSKVAWLNLLSEKKDKFCLSLKTIMNLKEDKLARLEQCLPTDTDDDWKRMIEALEWQVDNNPDLVQLRTENAELRERLESCSASDDKMQTRHEQLAIYNRELTDQIRELVSDKQLLQSRLQRLHVDGRRRSSMLSVEQRQCESLELEKWRAEQDFEGQLDVMRKELAQAYEAGIDATEAYRKLGEEKRRVEELQTVLENRNKALEELRASYDAIIHQLRDTHKKELSELEERHAQTRRDAIPEEIALLTSQIHDLTAERSQLTTERGRLQQQVWEVEKQLHLHKEDLARRDNEVITLGAKAQNADEERELASVAKQALEEEMTLLRSQLSASQESARRSNYDHETSLEQLQDRLDKSDMEVVHLGAQVTSRTLELEKKGAEIKSLRDELDVIMDEKQYRADQLDRTIAELYESRNALEKLSRKIEEDQEREGYLQTELEELRDQLQSQQNESASLSRITNENAQLKTELFETRLAMDETSQHLIEARAQLAKAQGTVVSLQQNLEDEETSSRTLGQTLCTLRETLELKEAELVKMQEQQLDLERQTTEYAMLQDRMDSLSSDREALMASHKAQVVELLSELDKRQQVLQACRKEHANEIESLRTLLKRNEEEILRLNKVSEERKRANNKGAGNLEALVANLQREVTRLQTEAITKDAEMKKCQEVKHQLTRQIAYHKDQSATKLEEKERQYAGLSNKLEHFRLEKDAELTVAQRTIEELERKCQSLEAQRNLFHFPSVIEASTDPSAGAFEARLQAQTDLKVRVVQLQERLAQSFSEREQLEQELDTVKKEEERATQQCNRYKARMEAMREIELRHSQLLEESQRKITETNVGHRNPKHRTQEVEIDQLRKEKNVLQDIIAEKQRRIERFSDELRKMRSIKGKEGDGINLEEEERLRQELETKNKELVRARKDIFNKGFRIQQLERQIRRETQKVEWLGPPFDERETRARPDEGGSSNTSRSVSPRPRRLPNPESPWSARGRRRQDPPPPPGTTPKRSRR